jgi:hypothetical protein
VSRAPRLRVLLTTWDVLPIRTTSRGVDLRTINPARSSHTSTYVLCCQQGDDVEPLDLATSEPRRTLTGPSSLVARLSEVSRTAILRSAATRMVSSREKSSHALLNVPACLKSPPELRMHLDPCTILSLRQYEGRRCDVDSSTTWTAPGPKIVINALTPGALTTCGNDADVVMQG